LGAAVVNLPPYANTPIGRELIAAIIRERPEYRITRGAWIEGGGTRSYAGKLAGRLRQLHKEWVEREYDALNRRFAVTHRWDADEAARILGTENGNQLIERVLTERGAELQVAA
jgi:hypothetical protein